MGVANDLHGDCCWGVDLRLHGTRGNDPVAVGNI